MTRSNTYVEFRDVSYILAVLQHGTLRKAAQYLYISESALSQALHAIECKWEATLFQRTGRRLAATATLDKLLPILLEIQNNGTRLAMVVNQLTHPDVLSLRLGIVSLARYCAWIALEEFVNHHGNQVQVEVVEHSTDDVVRRLLAGHLDAGIILRSDSLSNHTLANVSYSPLIGGQLVVVAPATMPIVDALTMSYDRLVRLPIVGYPRGYLIQDLLVNVLGESYEKSIIFTSTLQEWQQLALNSGQGVMLLPDFCVTALFPDCMRYQVIPLDPTISVELTFVTRDDYPPPIVSNILRSIRATSEQMGMKHHAK